MNDDTKIALLRMMDARRLRKEILMPPEHLNPGLLEKVKAWVMYWEYAYDPDREDMKGRFDFIITDRCKEVIEQLIEAGLMDEHKTFSFSPLSIEMEA